jgi:hypothetical protein
MMARVALLRAAGRLPRGWIADDNSPWSGARPRGVAAPGSSAGTGERHPVAAAGRPSGQILGKPDSKTTGQDSHST